MTVGGRIDEREDYMVHYAEIFKSQQLQCYIYRSDPMMIHGVNPMEE